MLWEIDKEDSSPGFTFVRFPKTSGIWRNILPQFTEPSMIPPCSCTMFVYQYGAAISVRDTISMGYLNFWMG